jgi:type IV pilus assembly protein PilB
LNLLRSPRRNIITVEDPVEYLLESVNQIQVHPKAGLTFASCLPRILRQDPDVIMVGEIRDGETAEIALRAAQTGHLVLSTLHTNDSIAAIPRLVDLGVPPYLIAASVTGIVAQRLVRKLCACKNLAPASSSYLRSLEKIGVSETERYAGMYEPKGCNACGQTGYSGRVGIYELLLIEGQIRHAIHSGSRIEEVSALARGAGFRSMQEDALEKVKDGLTTLEEVQRVVPSDSAKAERCHSCSREIIASFTWCPFCGKGRRNMEPLPFSNAR